LIENHLVEGPMRAGKVINKTREETYITEHAMTDRQMEMVLARSLINLMRERHH
jgi:hypothetical protein